MKQIQFSLCRRFYNTQFVNETNNYKNEYKQVKQNTKRDTHQNRTYHPVMQPSGVIKFLIPPPDPAIHDFATFISLLENFLLGTDLETENNRSL